MAVELFGAVLFQLLNGCVWGLAIALIALGLALIFGLTGVINLAHGEFYMLGAVSGWYLLSWTGSFWLAAALAPFMVSLIGLGVQQMVLRRLSSSPAVTVLVTFGLSLILQHGVLLAFGPSPRRLVAPLAATVDVLGRSYPVYRFVVAGLAVAALTGVALFLRFTLFGLWMRAVHQDREMALALGIPAQRVYLVTFGFGAGLAGLAGVLVAPIIGIEFRMGLDILPLAFMAVIVGGLGNLWGGVRVALLMGVLEGLLTVPLSPLMARVLTLSTLFSLVLLRSPAEWRALLKGGAI
ncbi:branched-chain amino acid ABC transporter permease [Candidatus Berkelbacteria bacterium]|nr:branched-chain amino acid ABC transporter permease [Candidatus Berkelbacteria bacterium]